jgi:hypothetical protein
MESVNTQDRLIAILYDGTVASVEQIKEAIGNQALHDCTAAAGYLMLPSGRILYVGEYFDSHSENHRL